MRYLLLFLLPFNAYAVHDCVFNPACSKKINESILGAALQAQDPDITLEVEYCTGDFSINGVVQPDTAQPTVVTVKNVPDQFTCNQVQTFLQNHNPAQNTFEEKQAAIQADKVTKADGVLPQTQTIQDILSRLDALEGQ